MIQEMSIIRHTCDMIAYAQTDMTAFNFNALFASGNN